jgi:predicted dienelactone hydrolase
MVLKRRSATLVGVLSIAALSLAGMQGVAAPAPTPKAGSVEVFDLTYVDTHRASSATSKQPAADSRTLVTTIELPERSAKKPAPLIVLAHGSGGNPNKFTELIGGWAAAGYVVAAPLFPRSSDVGGNLTSDVVNQPADVSFVIDRLLHDNKDRKSPLYRRIDPRHIGLAGLSAGGFTAYGLVFNTCCRDPRIKATIIMSGIPGPFPGGTYDYTGKPVPVLLLHGDRDELNLFPLSVNTYPKLAPPKWFVALHGSGHSSPYENSPDPNDDVVRATTLPFWDRYLRGKDDATDRLIDAVEASNGRATLEYDDG